MCSISWRGREDNCLWVKVILDVIEMNLLTGVLVITHSVFGIPRQLNAWMFWRAIDPVFGTYHQPVEVNL